MTTVRPAGPRAASCVAPLLTLALLPACDREPAPSAPEPLAALIADTTAITADVPGAPVLRLVDESTITDPAIQDRLRDIRRLATAAAVRVARLEPGADTLFVAGRPLAFDVNPRRRLVFLGTRRGETASGATSWVGALQGGRPGEVTVILSAIGLTAGMQVLPPDGATYAIQPLGGGLHAIIYVDQRPLPPD